MGGREGAGGPSRAGRVASPHIAGLAATVGRDAELRDLRAAFRTNRVQVLTGMGGVGKTSLARAYAQRHLADYGIVWWVRAEDPAVADAEFRALLEVLLPAGHVAQLTNARTAAFAQLAKEKDPWLLVLDNVPDAETVNGLLPPTGDGHILITSRAVAWPNATRVEPLDPDAAVELLTSQSGDADGASAKELATELGRLPLALTQAAGFVKANATTLATYLRLYRERSADLHQDGRPSDYPHTVATTWQLAMDRLTDPAREMLNVFAFCAPEDIPVQTIFSAMDELARHRALGELIAHSLVTAPGSNAITVHRLVQAVTRARLGPGAHEWADRTRVLIMTALRELLPATIVRNTKKPVTAAAAAIWITTYGHALTVLDHLPAEHPDALTARYVLAEGIGRWFLGAPPKARDLLAALLPLQVRALGEDHPDSIRTLSRLAYWTARTRDSARARDLAGRLLSLRERALGPEHVDTLAARNNLACWTGTSGDAPKARDLLTDLVPVQERVLGAGHVSTLITRNNLAYWTGRAGDAARARDLYLELLPIVEQELSSESQHAFAIRDSLAYWTKIAEGATPEREPFWTDLLIVEPDMD